MAVDAVAVADQDVERRVHAGQGHGVARVGAAVQHRTIGLEGHELLLAAEGRRARRTATDRLGDAGDVRGHAIELLGAAQRHPEAGDDLVEDEHHAVLVADAAQALEEARHRRDDAGVAQDRLGEHTGELVAVTLDQHLDGVDVVERRDHHGLLHGLWDTGARGQRTRELLRAPGSHGRHVRVRMAVEEAVVAPLPLHDLVLAGVAAGQADGRLRGLRAGVGEAQLLDAGHGLHDLAPDLVVELVREGVEHATLGDLLHDRVDDGLRAVTEDHWAVADAPVDVGVAVDVEDVAGLATIHDYGPRADQPRVARLAAGDDLLALCEQLARAHETAVVDENVGHVPDTPSERGTQARTRSYLRWNAPHPRASLLLYILLTRDGVNRRRQALQRKPADRATNRERRRVRCLRLSPFCP